MRPLLHDHLLVNNVPAGAKLVKSNKVGHLATLGACLLLTALLRVQCSHRWGLIMKTLKEWIFLDDTDLYNRIDQPC